MESIFSTHSVLDFTLFSGEGKGRSHTFFEMHGYFSVEKFLVLAPVALARHFKKVYSLKRLEISAVCA